MLTKILSSKLGTQRYMGMTKICKDMGFFCYSEMEVTKYIKYNKDVSEIKKYIIWNNFLYERSNIITIYPCEYCQKAMKDMGINEVIINT